MAIGVVANAAPVGVFPLALARKFTRKPAWLVRMNRYNSGEQQALPLVTTPRWAFEQEHGLTVAEAATLRAFHDDHQGRMIPFYMYVPSETSPRWTPDPTGAATQGRYTVRFDCPFEPSIGIGRLRVSIGLVLLEVA